jgi:hypothetical protein
MYLPFSGLHKTKSTAIGQPAIPAPSLFGVFSYLSITYEGILGLTSGSKSSCSARYILKTGFPFQESGRRTKATRSYPAVDLDYANVPSWTTLQDREWEEDLAKGILEAIDVDSYRVEEEGGHEDRAGGQGRRDRAGADRCLRPQGGARTRRLRNILKMFNEQLGTLFTDTDRVAKRIRDESI